MREIMACLFLHSSLSFSRIGVQSLTAQYLCFLIMSIIIVNICRLFNARNYDNFQKHLKNGHVFLKLCILVCYWYSQILQRTPAVFAKFSRHNVFCLHTLVAIYKNLYFITAANKTHNFWNMKDQCFFILDCRCFRTEMSIAW